jgi:DNA polymerase III alpha subunit
VRERAFSRSTSFCTFPVGVLGNAPYTTLLVHVENHAGYTNLCKILTESHRLHPKGQARDEDGVPRNLYAGVPLAYVCERAAGLWASLGSECSDEFARAVKEAFGERASLAVHRHLDGEDDERVRRARVANGVRRHDGKAPRAREGARLAVTALWMRPQTSASYDTSTGRTKSFAA